MKLNNGPAPDFDLAASMVLEGQPIGEIHKDTSVSVSTIRRWRRQGIPPRPGRSGRMPAKSPRKRLTVYVSEYTVRQIERSEMKPGRFLDKAVRALDCLK